MNVVRRALTSVAAALLLLPACTGGRGREPQPAEAWCGEHGVPEATCTKCKPGLIAGFRAKGDWCDEHGFPESVCPVCRPERLVGHPPPSRPPGSGAGGPSAARPPVRLAGPDVAAAAGITAVPAIERPVSDEIPCLGRIVYDPGRLAGLTSRVPGTVTRIPFAVGSTVAAGQAVAAVRSVEVGEAQARLRSARAANDLARSLYDRERRLRELGVNTEPEVTERRVAYEEARAALAAASEAVRLLADETGEPPPGGAGAAAAASGAPPGLCGDEPACITVRAPFAGTVISRPAFPGSHSGPGDVVLELADISVVWVELDLPDLDLPALRAMEGATAAIRVDGVPERTYAGVVAGILPEIDSRTRAARVRIEGIDNSDGRLRIGMFVRATIRSAVERTAVLIPRDAVQTIGGRAVAFVRRDADLFEPRDIRVAAGGGPLAEVVEGIAAGEAVVTEGGFLLKTEVLKESLGAGCVD